MVPQVQNHYGNLGCWVYLDLCSGVYRFLFGRVGNTGRANNGKVIDRRRNVKTYVLYPTVNIFPFGLSTKMTELIDDR